MTPGHRRKRRRSPVFHPGVFSLEDRKLLSTDVLTYHDDNSRTGADLAETTLTPADVNPTDFGKLGFLAVDAKVDAQPLVKTGVAIPGRGTHDVVYVATEDDSVYAFDAESGSLLWHDGPNSGSQALLGPNETAVPASDYNSDQVSPLIGITSTPVIDPATNSIDVVAMSKSVANGTTAYFQRIHALDLGTGADRVAPRSIDRSISSPGRGPGGNGTEVFFDPRQYDERDALTLSNGVVYTGWASHSDEAPYTGWVIGFNASNLGVAGVLNIDPNGAPSASNSVGESGNSFWNSGGGFAADASGNLYNISANGPFEPTSGDYGDAYLKLSTANGLGVADYFAPTNQKALSNADADLGSSGVVLLPPITDAAGDTPTLAIGSGKDGNIYVIDRANLGKFDATGNRIWQEVPGQLGGGLFATPAYFNGSVYFGAVGATLRAFSVAGAKVSASPTSQTPEAFGYPGTTPAISANGSANGIVWAAENGPTAVLHAYDASNLAHELYDSNQAPNGRDQFGPGNKFITPTVANGRVYVGTTAGVAVFGLLNPARPTPTPTPIPSPAPSFLIPAFPSPTFYVGGIDMLGAIGADRASGESSLTYTWTTTSTPVGAPTPSFSGNGTNATKLVSVGIVAPGSYTFRVTIQAPDGQSSASSVTVVATVPRPHIAIGAFSSAAPRAGAIPELGVIGSDDAFPESALTYTWSTLARPAGTAAPTFSSNGTNASKLVSVSYPRAGTYVVQVVVVNPFGQATLSIDTITVGA